MTDAQARLRTPADSRIYPVMKVIIGALTPLVKRLLRRRRPPAGLARNLLLLRFRGRSSGRWFETPVGYARAGDDITIVTLSDRQWPRNVRDGADVEVCVAGEWRRARARVLQPGDQYDAAVRIMFDARGRRGTRRLGLPVDESGS